MALHVKQPGMRITLKLWYSLYTGKAHALPLVLFLYASGYHRPSHKKALKLKFRNLAQPEDAHGNCDSCKSNYVWISW